MSYAQRTIWRWRGRGKQKKKKVLTIITKCDKLKNKLYHTAVCGQKQPEELIKENNNKKKKKKKKGARRFIFRRRRKTGRKSMCPTSSRRPPRRPCCGSLMRNNDDDSFVNLPVYFVGPGKSYARTHAWTSVVIFPSQLHRREVYGGRGAVD